MDPIEARSPELQRLRGRLTEIEGWLSEQDQLPVLDRHPKYAERQEVWLDILRKYERTYDRERHRQREEATQTRLSG